MIGAIHIGLLMQVFLAGGGVNPQEFIAIERLSRRVALAYWIGTDRRCNLTAIQSEKGLAIIDTEMSPRIMAPIKERIELTCGGAPLRKRRPPTAVPAEALTPGGKRGIRGQMNRPSRIPSGA